MIYKNSVHIWPRRQFAFIRKTNPEPLFEEIRVFVRSFLSDMQVQSTGKITEPYCQVRRCTAILTAKMWCELTVSGDKSVTLKKTNCPALSTFQSLRLTLCTASFNIQKFCVLLTMHLRVLRGSQNKQRFFSLYSNRLTAFITEAESVYCAVRTGSWN